MVNSQNKGTRNELAVRDKLRDWTGLSWERTPKSGALGAQHRLKGDVYLPDCKNKYCVEVKAYKDEQLDSSILTSKESQMHKWWKQATEQAKKVRMEPLLLFKKDRGKWFVATTFAPETVNIPFIYISDLFLYVMVLEEWIKEEEPIWILTP